MEAATPLFITSLASFYLLAVVTLTSFIKITVVLLILRNALGLQQVPTTMIVMALSLFLSGLIAMPVFSSSLQVVSSSELQFDTIDQLLVVLQGAVEPFQDFMKSNIESSRLLFFVDIADEIWAGSGMTASSDNFFVQVPAFVVSELTSGFEIGMILYLPFIAIDLSVTTILMALGMQQVQPSLISAPFKLLLFIFVDGWQKLVEGLLLSYNYV